MDGQCLGHPGLPQGPLKVIAIDELAGCLQVSMSLLNKPAQEGMVPGQKVGRHWRFHKTAIDAWLIEGGQGTSLKGA